MTHKTQTTYDGDRVIFACSCGYTRILNRRTHETTVYDPHPEDGEHSGGSGGVYMTASVDAGPDDASEIVRAVKEWSLRGGK